MFIYSSFHISSSRVTSRPPRNENKRTVFSFTFEIELVDVSVYDGHDPFLFEHTSVEISD